MRTPRATETLPVSGSSMPISIFRSVVLPPPFLPTIPIFSPRATRALTPTSTVSAP